MIKIGTKVRVLYAANEFEKEGIVISNPISEAGWIWYLIRFGHVSYTVPIENLVVIE